jgi:UDP-perosamine 4-acetyltransferase
MKSRIFIFGTGSHARKVFHCATLLGFEVAGFLDDDASARSPISNFKVFHSSTVGAPASTDVMFVAIGRGEVRKRVMDKFDSMGWNFPAIVHPTAWISPDARLDDGVLVAAGAIVETAAVIERGVIIDIGVLVDHDCRVGAYCHLTPGQVVRSGI